MYPTLSYRKVVTGEYGYLTTGTSTKIWEVPYRRYRYLRRYSSGNITIIVGFVRNGIRLKLLYGILNIIVDTRVSSTVPEGRYGTRKVPIPQGRVPVRFTNSKNYIGMVGTCTY